MSKLYEIKAYRETRDYEKCWIQIEADSPEEALKKAKDSPDECEYIDSKCIDVIDGEWVDQSEWEVTEV